MQMNLPRKKKTFSYKRSSERGRDGGREVGREGGREAKLIAMQKTPHHMCGTQALS